MTIEQAKRIVDEWLIVSKSLEGREDTWKTYIDNIVLEAIWYVLDNYPLTYIALDKKRIGLF